MRLHALLCIGTLTCLAYADQDSAPTDRIQSGRGDYAKDNSVPLATGRFTLFICEEHFPEGSAVRAEAEKAAAAYHGLPGVDIEIAIAPKPHHTPDQLYRPRPAYSMMDYVDNQNEGIPGHPAGDTKGWAMNTSRKWGKGERPKTFIIAVNANAYKGKRHPKFDGIMHEIGHALGMTHMETHANKAMLSTMAGNPDILTAYDVGFLRHFYPTQDAYEGIDLLPSPDVRLKSRSANGYSTDPVAVPEALKADAEGLWILDAKTGEKPVIEIAWFNYGTRNSGQPFKCALYLGEVQVASWTAAALPGESQDHRRLSLDIPLDLVSSLKGQKAVSWSFAVDIEGKVDESAETNNRLVLGSSEIQGRP